MDNKQLLYSIDKIKEEISKVGISKDKINQIQKYKFRGIDDVYNTLCPLLAKYNITIIPSNMEIIKEEERKSNNGGIISFVKIRVIYSIYHPESTSINAITFGEAMDSSDKALNKAMSSAYKYLCFQIFAIPTEGKKDVEEDDIQLASLSESAKTSIKKTNNLEELTEVFKLLSNTEDKKLLTEACSERKKEIIQSNYPNSLLFKEGE